MRAVFIYIVVILTIYISDEYVATKMMGPLFNINTSYIVYILSTLFSVMVLFAVYKIKHMICGCDMKKMSDACEEPK